MALEAVHTAGKIQRQHYGQKLDIQTKSSAIDLVTQVDKACDAEIQRILLERSDQLELPQPVLITEESFPRRRGCDAE